MKELVVNIVMVAFQKAECVASQWTGQIPDMFVLQNNFLYLYMCFTMMYSQMNLVQQSSAKVQECKNL